MFTLRTRRLRIVPVRLIEEPHEIILAGHRYDGPAFIKGATIGRVCFFVVWARVE